MFRVAEPTLHRELHAAADSFGDHGFTVTDLVRCAARRNLTGSVSSVATWLASALREGDLVDMGIAREPDGGLGPRRYRTSYEPLPPEPTR